MRPFERLLYATGAELEKILQHLQPPLAREQQQFLDDLARKLGLERAQLVCACGFNPNLLRLPRLIAVLGFGSFGALWRERDHMFTEDVYRALTIEDIQAIHAVIGRGDGDSGLSELIRRRLGTIEGQIEATINPVTLGCYKLEVRSIYEHNLISRTFIDWRLEADYAVLRRLSNEITMMLASGLVKPTEILAEPGVTVEEKTRLVHDRLVSAEAVAAHLEHSSLPEPERHALEQALRQRAAG